MLKYFAKTRNAFHDSVIFTILKQGRRLSLDMEKTPTKQTNFLQSLQIKARSHVKFLAFFMINTFDLFNVMCEHLQRTIFKRWEKRAKTLRVNKPLYQFNRF